MEISEMKRRFHAAMNDALSGTGATLDDDGRAGVDEVMEKAATHISRLEENRQEKRVADGEAAYRRLAGEMVAFVKRNKLPLELNLGVVQAALWNLRYLREGDIFW
jgi:hypothetical protein